MFLMAWFGYSRLYSVFEWLCRRLYALWRCTAAVVRPIVRYAFLAIKNPRRCQDEPEPGHEDELREGGSEGQPRAAGSKLPVREDRDQSDNDRYPVEQRYEEGNDDDDGDDDIDSDSDEYRVQTTDELYCGYDSTWETEEDQETTVRRTRQRAWGNPSAGHHYKFRRFENASRDMQNYRHHYPNRPQQWIMPDDMPNLNFYLGQTPSLPDGVYIHSFHDEWAENYEVLERVHTYIQWLFPLQEPGVNYEATPLTKEEIKCFLENSTAKKNLLKSYDIMLDFYGIKLCNKETGEVKRASNWIERFHNLNTHTHNNLRITRILKCLGTLGYAHYQAPLVRFFLEETLVNGELPNVKDSVLNYFMFAVLDKRQRRDLIKFAYLKYDRKSEFVWCPKKIQMIWSNSY
uniref:opioid growth factor receptor-like isoform X2 n=1 Tax=Scatophagus argus TaxID=75038 RepID=UPI001ED7EA23|nr:opioid growth factor receptor-like isoform X2 [Scatophagus argus]